MKAKSIGKMLLPVLSIIVISLMSAGYINNLPAGTPQTGPVKLVYNYPAGDYVKYMHTNKIIQTMDIEGQSMQVKVNSSLGCSIRSGGTSGNTLMLEIRIDTLGQTIDTPQGYSGGAIQSVKDKSFNMSITVSGKETDVQDAQKLVYFIEGSGETNASQLFHNFFPDLPVNPIKPGETWNANDTSDLITPTMSMKTITNSVNKFEGIEKVNGIECAKITSELSGTQTMRTETQGMQISTSGSFTGTSTLLFPLNEGYFIEQNVSARMKGIIDVSGQMTFPLTMETNTSTKMLK
ncbi:MAG: hypothetical protein R6W81_11000 [Bacteroidales bacterium]